MIPEKELAERMGLSRPALRKMRGELLRQDEHFTVREHDGAILITDAGVAVLENAAGLKTGADENAGLDPAEAVDGFGGVPPFAGAAENKPATVTATVEQWRFKNRRIIQCQITSPAAMCGDKLMVRVPDNEKFREGMRVCALMDRPGYGTLKGRGPRWPGKW